MGNTLGSGTAEVPDNRIGFCVEVIPQEVMEHIFLYVPVKDLVTSVTRVCKYWHRLLIEYRFWFIKAQAEGFNVSAAAKERLLEETNEALVLRILQGICGDYLHLNTNLILNPSGQEGFKHWTVKHGGDKIIVEDVPAGSDPIPDEAGLPTQHCFVTSYSTCIRIQVINLESIGLDPQIVDILKPKVHISEWVSARWDCHSENQVIVEFRGAENRNLVSMNWSSDKDDVIGSKWYKMEKIVVDYPRGLKIIKYSNVGKDRQFWAGHYGAKTAGSSVKLVL